jgi:uncharacterized protein (UPF0332 family)
VGWHHQNVTLRDQAVLTVSQYHMTVMSEGSDEYFDKAEESFAGAESEYVNSRYNNCANRCYYAAFQAAIYALVGSGIRPLGASDQWGHDFVQAQVIGQLVNRRKIYPTSLRNTLEQNYRLRETADYQRDHVTEVRAARAVRRTEEFLGAIR